jgi:hypothetical protein
MIEVPFLQFSLHCTQEVHLHKEHNDTRTEAKAGGHSCPRLRQQRHLEAEEGGLGVPSTPQWSTNSSNIPYII